MKPYLLDTLMLFESVLHPAAGKMIAEKKKKRSTLSPVNPKATPDSSNIRDIIKRQDSVRRNPTP